MEKQIIKKESGNEYIVGTYRIWKQPSGGIGIKFDGEKELPKGTDLYHKINKRFETEK